MNVIEREKNSNKELSFDIAKRNINGEEVNSIDLRELYDYLEVKTNFSEWTKRNLMGKGFEENSDFVLITPNLELIPAGRPPINYVVTMDVAKELAMMSNTVKGKEARQYFIRKEKELNQLLTSNTMQVENSLLASLIVKQLESIDKLTDLVTTLAVNKSVVKEEPVVVEKTEEKVTNTYICDDYILHPIIVSVLGKNINPEINLNWNEKVNVVKFIDFLSKLKVPTKYREDIVTFLKTNKYIFQHPKGVRSDYTFAKKQFTRNKKLSLSDIYPFYTTGSTTLTVSPDGIIVLGKIIIHEVKRLQVINNENVLVEPNKFVELCAKHIKYPQINWL